MKGNKNEFIFTEYQDFQNLYLSLYCKKKEPFLRTRFKN